MKVPRVTSHREDVNIASLLLDLPENLCFSIFQKTISENALHETASPLFLACKQLNSLSWQYFANRKGYQENIIARDWKKTYHLFSRIQNLINNISNANDKKETQTHFDNLTKTKYLETAKTIFEPIFAKLEYTDKIEFTKTLDVLINARGFVFDLCTNLNYLELANWIIDLEKDETSKSNGLTILFNTCLKHKNFVEAKKVISKINEPLWKFQLQIELLKISKSEYPPQEVLDTIYQIDDHYEKVLYLVKFNVIFPNPNLENTIQDLIGKMLPSDTLEISHILYCQIEFLKTTPSEDTINNAIALFDKLNGFDLSERENQKELFLISLKENFIDLARVIIDKMSDPFYKANALIKLKDRSPVENDIILKNINNINDSSQKIESLVNLIKHFPNTELINEVQRVINEILKNNNLIEEDLQRHLTTATKQVIKSYAQIKEFHSAISSIDQLSVPYQKILVLIDLLNESKDNFSKSGFIEKGTEIIARTEDPFLQARLLIDLAKVIPNKNLLKNGRAIISQLKEPYLQTKFLIELLEIFPLGVKIDEIIEKTQKIDNPYLKTLTLANLIYVVKNEEDLEKVSQIIKSDPYLDLNAKNKIKLMIHNTSDEDLDEDAKKIIKNIIDNLSDNLQGINLQNTTLKILKSMPEQELEGNVKDTLKRIIKFIPKKFLDNSPKEMILALSHNSTERERTKVITLINRIYSSKLKREAREYLKKIAPSEAPYSP